MFEAEKAFITRDTYLSYPRYIRGIAAPKNDKYHRWLVSVRVFVIANKPQDILFHTQLIVVLLFTVHLLEYPTCVD